MDETAYSDGASGSYLDGFTSWMGDFAYRYSERWLDEEYPERTEPVNQDNVIDPAATTAQPTKGFQLDQNTMLIGGVVLVAALFMFKG